MAQLDDELIQYTAFDGDVYSREVWLGEHVALIPTQATAEKSAIDNLTAALDSGYEYYVNLTGRAPTSYNLVQGRLPIAVLMRLAAPAADTSALRESSCCQTFSRAACKDVSKLRAPTMRWPAAE